MSSLEPYPQFFENVYRGIRHVVEKTLLRRSILGLDVVNVLALPNVPTQLRHADLSQSRLESETLRHELAYLVDAILVGPLATQPPQRLTIHLSRRKNSISRYGSILARMLVACPSISPRAARRKEFCSFLFSLCALVVI